MGVLIGPVGTTFSVEQPGSPAVSKDASGNLQIERTYLIHKDNIPAVIAAATPNTVDPDYTSAQFAGMRAEIASASTRYLTVTYREPDYSEEIESIGTVTRSADANPILEPLEKRLTNSTDIETAKADGIEGFMRSAPKYRYKKIKSGGAFGWTEEEIISGVGKVDNAPSGMTSPSENKWLMDEHTIREVGGLLEEEWGWQYNEEGWEVANPALYDVWTGSAS